MNAHVSKGGQLASTKDCVKDEYIGPAGVCRKWCQCRYVLRKMRESCVCLCCFAFVLSPPNMVSRKMARTRGGSGCSASGVAGGPACKQPKGLMTPRQSKSGDLKSTHLNLLAGDLDVRRLAET
jgi:hypothetical protein